MRLNSRVEVTEAVSLICCLLLVFLGGFMILIQDMPGMGVGFILLAGIIGILACLSMRNES